MIEITCLGMSRIRTKCLHNEKNKHIRKPTRIEMRIKSDNIKNKYYLKNGN